ncbi:MAG: deoxyribose-phosphate aldolase [Eubacteriales bacterium]|nr:deoxyribose-phosphate aldolase [Eubacteriales bacterium]MDD4186884.1 deoxyribose-phosphate aldolase [Eubacteriales bacterium]
MKPDKPAIEMTIPELARYIDQSVLKPEFTDQDIQTYIEEGIEFGCKTVCINPSALLLAAELTRGTDTEICVVSDFPFGLGTEKERLYQVEQLCRYEGVTELDIVANYGKIRSGMYEDVKRDIAGIANACHAHGVQLKTIMETDALTLDEILRTVDVLIEAGSDFVKTSTGFYTGGPTKGADIELMAKIIERVDGRCKVKGSGNIRTREHFLTLIDMGVDRMGIGYRSTPVVLGLPL